jgi:hypothetical protein
MLDKLQALFTENSVRGVAEVMVNVVNLVEQISAKVGGDAAKLNEAIDYVKAMFDQQKK